MWYAFGLLLPAMAMANPVGTMPLPSDSLSLLSFDSLKTLSGSWRIDIYRDGARLVLSKGDFPVRNYLCAVGNDTIGKPTPHGEFKIIGKIKDPPMYWRNGTRIPPGDWRNSYGPRWLSLGTAKRGTYQRYGIHGTNAPHAIGKHISSGCIRLYNEDVIELFDLVPEGTRVHIH